MKHSEQLIQCEGGVMKKKTNSPDHAANRAEAKNYKQNNYTTISSPRQLRALKMHVNTTEAVLSFDLRKVAGVMNVSHVVCKLRDKGFTIDCQIENYKDLDEVETKIGRYILNSKQRQDASDFLREVSK